MNCRIFTVTLFGLLVFSTVITGVLGVDTKYVHFREFTIDGNDDDWDGIESEALVTSLKRQIGHLVNIDNKTFYPGNVTAEEGDAIIWKNLDENTTSTKKHQISLNEDAPFTWTGNAMDYQEEDFLILREIENETESYAYHTSRINWYQYPDGNITVEEVEWEPYSFGMAFASSQTNLYISLSLLNISNLVGEYRYLKGIDILFDDFADGAIQGENAVKIEMDGSTYSAKDMYYDSGYLEEDTNDGETSDITMAYNHDIPDFEENLTYLGDFFFEMEIPIDSDDFRDLGASSGQSIGIEVILRISTSEQDQEGQKIGINNYLRGGGYPILVTQNKDDIDRLEVDGDDFLIVDLSGGTIVEILGTILEELLIWIISTVSLVVSFLFGGIILNRKRKNDPRCPDGNNAIYKVSFQRFFY